MQFSYIINDDTITAWLQDEKTGKIRVSAQFLRRDVEYVTARLIKEMELTPEEAFDLAVYFVFVKASWGL
jgi:hypothetical protein